MSITNGCGKAVLISPNKSHYLLLWHTANEHLLSPFADHMRRWNLAHYGKHVCFQCAGRVGGWGYIGRMVQRRWLTLLPHLDKVITSCGRRLGPITRFTFAHVAQMLPKRQSKRNHCSKVHHGSMKLFIDLGTFTSLRINNVHLWPHLKTRWISVQWLRTQATRTLKKGGLWNTSVE